MHPKEPGRSKWKECRNRTGLGHLLFRHSQGTEVPFGTPERQPCRGWRDQRTLGVLQEAASGSRHKWSCFWCWEHNAMYSCLPCRPKALWPVSPLLSRLIWKVDLFRKKSPNGKNRPREHLYRGECLVCRCTDVVTGTQIWQYNESVLVTNLDKWWNCI